MTKTGEIIYRAYEMSLLSRDVNHDEVANPPKGFKGDVIDRFGSFNNVAKEFVFPSTVDKETLESVFSRHMRERTPFYVPTELSNDGEGHETLDFFMVDPANKKITFCAPTGESMGNFIKPRTQAVFDRISTLSQDFVFIVKI